MCYLLTYTLVRMGSTGKLLKTLVTLMAHHDASLNSFNQLLSPGTCGVFLG